MFKYILKKPKLIGLTFSSGLYLKYYSDTNISSCKNYYNRNLDNYQNENESFNQNNINSPDNFDKLEFSRFENERIIRIYGEINERQSCIIIDCLDILDQKNSNPIKLIINSGGGSISQGLAICDKMNKINSPVYTKCEGECASIASIILANGEKGNRSISPNSTVFIHEAYTNISNVSLTIFELSGRLESLKIHRDQIIQILHKITGKPITEIEIIMKNDTTFTSQEAIDNNIVDYIDNN